MLRAHDRNERMWTRDGTASVSVSEGTASLPHA